MSEQGKPVRWRIVDDEYLDRLEVQEDVAPYEVVGYADDDQESFIERIVEEHNALVDLWERCQISSMRGRTDWVEAIVAPALGLGAPPHPAEGEAT